MVRAWSSTAEAQSARLVYLNEEPGIALGIGGKTLLRVLTSVKRNSGRSPLVLWGSLPGKGQLGPVELLPEWGQAGWSNPAILHPSGGHFLIGGLSGGQFELDHYRPRILGLYQR